jgi:L-histidine N-alpha-methyltransferase
MVANYVTHLRKLERFKGTTLAMYIGSNIGNFSPEEARTILRNLRSELRAGDALLLGTDMVKDEATLVRAYGEKDGVTAAFILNILHRLNRELGANFDTGCFRHRARWNRVESRIEMHLESTRDQRVNIPAAQLSVQFAALETIHTENSYKFTRNTLGALLDDAGFAIAQTWTGSATVVCAYARGPSVIAVNRKSEPRSSPKKSGDPIRGVSKLLREHGQCRMQAG